MLMSGILLSILFIIITICIVLDLDIHKVFKKIYIDIITLLDDLKDNK